MNDISYLIRKLESYRVIFKPGKTDYLLFLFEFNAKVIEHYYPRDSLTKHLPEFISIVRQQVNQDLATAKSYYYKKNGVRTIFWVPPVNKLDSLVKEYVKHCEKQSR